MKKKYLIAIICIFIFIIISGIYSCYILFSILTGANTLFRQIPIHPSLTFLAKTTTGYPDSTPSTIYSYEITQPIDLSLLVDYYQGELPQLGWKPLLKETVNLPFDYGTYTYEKKYHYVNFHLTITILSDQQTPQNNYNILSFKISP